MTKDQLQEYQDFYNQVGEVIGWDFSSVQLTREGQSWRFYNKVTDAAGSNDLLLDLGCGGGKKLLTVAEDFLLIVGIDSAEGMIKTAKENLAQSQANNVRFLPMDAKKVKFPDQFFDLISCRHAPFDAQEVFRLLKPDGVFLTQQVSEGDKLNIKEHFGRGQDYGQEDGASCKQRAKNLKAAGFSQVTQDQYNAVEYYHRPKDLIFLLKHTPIIVDFGKKSDDFTKLESFITENTTSQGIKTNSKRYLLRAEK